MLSAPSVPVIVSAFLVPTHEPSSLLGHVIAFANATPLAKTIAIAIIASRRADRLILIYPLPERGD